MNSHPLRRPPPLTPFRKLRAAWSRFSTWGKFRNPAVDFQLSEDRITSYSSKQPREVQTGPYIYDKGEYVSLHMVGDAVMAVHSIMSRSSPERLMLSYTEIMMGFPRFTDSPRSIGMIGLGGGSLAKYCYHYLPECHITVAEISSEVIALRREFSIPDDDDRLHILHIDGAEMIRQNANTYDVLMIDAFDEGGYPAHFGARAFYQDCYRSLTANGVLVVNLSGFDWRTWYKRMSSVFQGHSVLYACPDGDNVIAFATKKKLPNWTRQ
ncbi:MAG TPA: fused MFS/spermidine synthase [Granulicella sp.]